MNVSEVLLSARRRKRFRFRCAFQLARCAVSLHTAFGYFARSFQHRGQIEDLRPPKTAKVEYIHNSQDDVCGFKRRRPDLMESIYQLICCSVLGCAAGSHCRRLKVLYKVRCRPSNSFRLFRAIVRRPLKDAVV